MQNFPFSVLMQLQFRSACVRLLKLVERKLEYKSVKVKLSIPDSGLHFE